MKPFRLWLVAVGWLAASAAATPAAHAQANTCFATWDLATIYSSTTASAVRQAVAEAPDFGTVRVAGLCAEASVEAVLYITRPVTVQGGYTVTNWLTATPAVHPTVLAAQSGGRVVLAEAPATFSGLVIRDGSASWGAGMASTSPLTLSELLVTNNHSTGDGGGLWASAPVVISGSVFSGNTGRNGGGAWLGGQSQIYTSTFSGNQANIHGGGAYLAEAAEVHASTFGGNHSAISGGGAYFQAASQVRASTFGGNQSASGGGAYMNAATRVTETVFNLNQATNGDGGGAVMGLAERLESVSFVSNTAMTDGGGAYFGWAQQLSATTFAGNSAQSDGGGAFFGLAGWLTHTTFYSNQAQVRGGGAMFNTAVNLWHGLTATTNEAPLGGGVFFATNALMHGGVLSGNVAQNGGGAMFSGYAELSGTVVSHNRAQFGGGAFVMHSGNFERVQFLFNTSTVSGGGLNVFGGQSNTVRVYNSLFNGNHAPEGGAIVAEHNAVTGPDTLFIMHTTIVSPTFGARHAVLVRDGKVHITNTVLASYTVGVERWGGLVTEDYNLYGLGGQALSGTVSVGQNSWAGFTRFADHTNYQLTATSTAVDKGVNLGLGPDFFGRPRPFGPAPDMGYAEYSPVVWRLFLPLTLR